MKAIKDPAAARVFAVEGVPRGGRALELPRRAEF